MKHGYSAGEAERCSICWADRGYVWPPVERGLGVLMREKQEARCRQQLSIGAVQCSLRECEEEKRFGSQ